VAPATNSVAHADHRMRAGRERMLHHQEVGLLAGRLADVEPATSLPVVTMMVPLGPALAPR